VRVITGFIVFHLYATLVGRCAAGSYVEFYVYVKDREQENIPAIEGTIIVLGAIRVGSFPSVWDRSGFDHGGGLRGLGERAGSLCEGPLLDGGKRIGVRRESVERRV
jgi:hypothetical protein